MSAVYALRRLKEQRLRELDEELNNCRLIKGKKLEAVRAYLLQEEVFSIRDVTDEISLNFRAYVHRQDGLSWDQKKAYESALETIVFEYYSKENPSFLYELEGENPPSPEIRKAEMYLLSHGISSAEEINYDVREGYRQYLLRSIASSKVMEYVRAVDNIKLAAIQRNCEHPLRDRRLKYDGGKVFLLYHPDYKIATTFNYVQDKEELLFDFTLPGSELAKRQVFLMLNHVLETQQDWKMRRERFLVPLRHLYLFCMEQQIADIEQLEKSSIRQFYERLEGLQVDKADDYYQIVDNIRKFLFFQAKKINWEANVWYLEKMHILNGRMNPANPTASFAFYPVADKENRRAFQHYMKYLIGISQLSVNTIKVKYYAIRQFLEYCDEKQLSALTVSPEDMDHYFEWVDKDIQAATFNDKLDGITGFFQFMVVKDMRSEMPFVKAYYVKHEILTHHDRSVPQETINAILSNLYQFPEPIRLMYLHLWCLGLRVSEVCILKGDAYFVQNGDAWIRVHQNKMRAEKVIPIPTMLYKAMKSWIEKNKISADKYVFQNTTGGAYREITFRHQMIRMCEKLGIDCGEYVFRAHDYRHTVSTSMYQKNISLPTIRDYLGHQSEDMTKQYIDYLPKKIDLANQRYFMNKENQLAPELREGEESFENSLV